jgi:mannose-6-phosphate isomerase
LLLKFLDARELLSVQVHPSDKQTDYLPANEQGKTEAWVVLEAGARSRVYAGLKEGVTQDDLLQSLGNKCVSEHLASFSPRPGDAVFLPAGIVHSLGDLVVFEVQQNSDVTFRLYDWDHIDAKTGKPRDLQVKQAMACIDYTQTNVGPVTPVVETMMPVLRERIFQCEHFVLWRLRGELPFEVGAVEIPRVLVCLDGKGQLEHNGDLYPVNKGDVLLLPAVVGICPFQPLGDVCLLEIALPEN